MAQRNPMNERYQGDGPQGKTRKSAAKLKPKVEAASSVHVEKRPVNKQERKAARKKRDAQLAAKVAERKRKAEERERKEREATGEATQPGKPQTLGAKIKGFLFAPAPPKNQTASGASGASGAGKASASSDTQPRVSLRGPDTPEYQRLRRVYWILLGIGVAALIVSFFINYAAPSLADGWGGLLPMIIAYPAVIGALILDFTKLKKLRTAHETNPTGRQSPKQQKHAQEKAEAAALLEASKKAKREQRRAALPLPFARGKTKTALDDTESGETDEADEADEAGEAGESDRPDALAEPLEADESTGEADKTGEPNETGKANEAGEADGVNEANEASEASEPPASPEKKDEQ